jgi:hypothetical protein
LLTGGVTGGGALGNAGEHLITVPGPTDNAFMPTSPTSYGLGFLTLNGNIWNAAKTGSGSGAINTLIASGNLIVISP